jgi:hypothetical protein
MTGTETSAVRPAVDWNRWITLVQVAAVCVSAVGVVLLWWQLRLSTEATQALVVQSLTVQSEESLRAAMAHPNATRLLFPMFGPATTKLGPDDFLRAQLLARDQLCHFEAILAQENQMPEDQRAGFRHLMTFMFSASPMLHQAVDESSKDFYSPKLRQIARESPARPVRASR